MYVAKIYLINVCLPYFNPEHCLLKPKLRTSHEKRCVIIHHFDGQSLLIEIAKKYLPRHVHRARLFSFFFFKQRLIQTPDITPFVWYRSGHRWCGIIFIAFK